MCRGGDDGKGVAGLGTWRSRGALQSQRPWPAWLQARLQRTLCHMKDTFSGTFLGGYKLFPLLVLQIQDLGG